MQPFLILAASLFIAFVLFVVGEYVRRELGHSNEASRKLFHIISGLIVTAWAFLINYKFIIGVEIIFVIASLLSRKLGWYKWLFDVGRKTWGEIFFALGVIVAALFSNSKWIYAAAILEVGLADAAAALVGQQFGKYNQYTIFGHKKSVAGSVACWLTSVIIISLIVVFSPHQFAHSSYHVIFWLPLVITFIENASPFGLDNILVPIVVIAVLNSL